MDRAALGQPAQVQKAGRPIGFVERAEDRAPEGALLARGDERRAEEGLLVAPIPDQANGQPGVTGLDRHRQQADQPAAAANLDQADFAARRHRRQRGGDEPMLGERVRLGRDRGERGPFGSERVERLGRRPNPCPNLERGRHGFEPGRRHARPVRLPRDPAQRIHGRRDSAQR